MDKKGNPLLNHFLEGCKHVNINKENNEKKMNAFAHSIGQVMYVKKPKYNNTIFILKKSYYIVTNAKNCPLWIKNGKVVVAPELSVISFVNQSPLECPNKDLFNTINSNQKVVIHLDVLEYLLKYLWVFVNQSVK